MALLALELCLVDPVNVLFVVYVLLDRSVVVLARVLEAHLLRCRVRDHRHLVIERLRERIASRPRRDSLRKLSLPKVERVVSLPWCHHQRQGAVLVER